MCVQDKSIKWRESRPRAPPNAPKAYLGRSENNVYDPVLVCWTGSSDWKENCGALWWSPAAMGLKSCNGATVTQVVHPGASFVPIEDVLVSHTSCNTLSLLYVPYLTLCVFFYTLFNHI